MLGGAPSPENKPSRLAMVSRGALSRIVLRVAFASAWIGVYRALTFTVPSLRGQTRRQAHVASGLLHTVSRRSSRSLTARKAEGGQAAAAGLVVAVDFKMCRSDTGEVIDSTEGKGPLEFQCGAGMIFPALEFGVLGMTVGESKDIAISGAGGFGDLDEEKIVDMLANQVPPDAVPGQLLTMRGPQGPMKATILSRNDTIVMLDFNHPLAGIDLTMSITVLSIKEPPDEGDLVVETITPGDGKTYPKAGDVLEMHYTGTLAADGKEFDSSVDRGQPFGFQIGVGQVIRGWDAGVIQMSLGEKAILRIPAALGYGDRGAGGVIPPGADLIFEVELLKISSPV